MVVTPQPSPVPRSWMAAHAALSLLSCSETAWYTYGTELDWAFQHADRRLASVSSRLFNDWLVLLDTIAFDTARQRCMAYDSHNDDLHPVERVMNVTLSIFIHIYSVRGRRKCRYSRLLIW